MPKPLKQSNRQVGRPDLSVPEQHAFKIAKQTLRMNDAMVGVMGGMTKAEARQFLRTKAGWTDDSIARFEAQLFGDDS